MAFGAFKVLAGDFTKGPGASHQVLNGNLLMSRPGKFFRETIPLTDVAAIEILNEENKHRLGGSIGGAIVGDLLLGPVGALAGAMVGGSGKEVTFVCTLRDGRGFMATGPLSVHNEILAGTFQSDHAARAAASTPASKKGPSSLAALLVVLVVSIACCLYQRNEDRRPAAPQPAQVAAPVAPPPLPPAPLPAAAPAPPPRRSRH